MTTDRHRPDGERPASPLRALLWLLPMGLLATGVWLLSGALTRAQEAAVRPATDWLAVVPGTTLERIAFGSCLDQRRPQPIWSRVLEARPQLMVMTGDNVYGDSKEAALTELKAAYAAQAIQPELALVRARVPFLATWDDHDCGYNDASGSFPWKAASRDLFASFWQLTRAALPKEGIYRAHVFGPAGRRVQIILLDLRSFRSAFAELTPEERTGVSRHSRYKPDPDPRKTMLGAVQWAWLEQQLEAPAEIRLIVSSTQLLAEAHGWERWGHIPAERTRFFALLGKTAARGVIVLSGDRHRATIYKRTEGLGVPLYDVTSSALNRTVAGTEPDDAGRLMPMLAEDNFGLIAIDWTARRLELKIMPLSGRAGPAVTIPFDEVGIK